MAITFTANVAGDGGALWCGSLVIHCTFADNFALHNGGGIFSGGLTVRDCSLTGNSAGNFDGGIYNAVIFATLTGQGSEVVDNDPLLGDDIYNLGALEVIDSVIGEMFP